MCLKCLDFNYIFHGENCIKKLPGLLCKSNKEASLGLIDMNITEAGKTNNYITGLS